MNKRISLLCAGLLMSAVMVGCSKPEEGDTSTTTTSGAGKSDMKSDTGTPEQPKTEGTGESGGEMKSEGGK